MHDLHGARAVDKAPMKTIDAHGIVHDRLSDQPPDMVACRRLVGLIHLAPATEPTTCMECAIAPMGGGVNNGCVHNDGVSLLLVHVCPFETRWSHRNYDYRCRCCPECVEACRKDSCECCGEEP